MKIEELTKLERELKEELLADKDHLNGFDVQLKTATAANLDEIILKRNKAQADYDLTVAKIRQVQMNMRELEAQAKKEAELAVAKDRQIKTDFLKENPPPCPRCGKPGVLAEGFRQPTVRGSEWFLSYDCSDPSRFRCGLRWQFHPDKELEMKDQKPKHRTRPPKRKSLTSGYLPIAVT